MQFTSEVTNLRSVGPYSVAVSSEGFIFSSGIIGVDKDGVLARSFENQVQNIFTHILTILTHHGLEIADVIKTTVFLKDMADYSKLNEAYAHFMGTHRPARSTIGVASLPKDARIEIEFIARAKTL